MRKTILWILLFTILATSILCFAKEDITIYIDNQKIELSEPVYIINNRTLVPFRAVFEKFNAKVLWNTDLNKVVAIRRCDGLDIGDLSLDNFDQVFCDNVLDMIEITIDGNTAKINGAVKDLDVPPTIINDRTYVPLRFIAEGLDFMVNWNSNERRVDIDTNKIKETISNTIEERGNTIGNLANFGFYSYSDDYLYITGVGKYLKATPDLSEFSIVPNQIPFCTDKNIYDGNLYYDNILTFDHCVNKVHLSDIKNAIRLSDDIEKGIVLSLNLVDDKLFFSRRAGKLFDTSTNAGIYVMGLNGENEKKLSNDMSFSLVATKGNIYYIKADDKDHCYEIKSIDYNGQNERIICTLEDGIVSTTRFIVDNGFIYYNSGRFGIKKIRISDGRPFHVISKNTIKDSSFTIVDDKLYYIGFNSEKALFRANLDGTDRKQLSDIVIDSIMDTGDWIYVRSAKGYYRLHKDGDSLEFVFDFDFNRDNIMSSEKNYAKTIINSEQDPDYAVMEITKILWKKYDSDFQNMTDEEKNILLLQNLEAEVNNGGFDQFFFNGYNINFFDGQFVRMTLKALKEIKAEYTYQLLEKAIGIIGDSTTGSQDDSQSSALYELDKVFYQYKDNLTMLQMDYIKENIDSF